MSENKKEEFRRLVEKYLNRAATEEESAALTSYYNLFKDAPEISELLSEEQLEALESRMKSKITERIQASERASSQSSYYIKAAVVATLLFGATWLLKLYEKQPAPALAIEAPDSVSFDGADQDISRFITLPDSSTVILNAGSSLTVDSSFNRFARIVNLTGEAYFDVKQREGIPFIIHTGKLKTTVLGTAFNIKAWPGQKDIVVSVSRGKVKIEDESKLIAVLTPDKQIIYNTQTHASEEQIVDVPETITWIEQDMTFDDTPFGVLAERLGKRFGVDITFSNHQLTNCPITGRFSGTETLDEVLRTLTLTSNTSYRIDSNKIIINGENCY